MINCRRCDTPTLENDLTYDGDCPDCSGKYVSCDDRHCRALRDPQTIEELKEAVEHWHYHGYLSGCSHAN